MSIYSFHELPVPLHQKDSAKQKLARELRIREHEIQDFKILRYSLDSRKKNAPHWSFNVQFKYAGALLSHPRLSLAAPVAETLKDDPYYRSIPFPQEIAIVGAGPAGLWAALHFLRCGFRVHLYEQGKPVEERMKDIRRFFINRELNPYSNVLFGEGGAGTFSDGKLNTRSRNIFSQTVLEDMVAAGISEEILTFAKPHIGTDKLFYLLKNLRRQILELGGQIHFESRLEDIQTSAGRLSQIRVNGKWLSAEALVLASGHSAREVYALLRDRGVALESKAFAMGVRVEHPQALINACRLGKNTDTRITGSAEYALIAKTLNDTSAAYSFCMCPGGVLVPCASEAGTLATNGMSHSHRRGPWANGAIVVPIPASASLWGNLNAQRNLEQKAFEIGGKNYAAPAQTIEAFLHQKTDLKLPHSTYPCGLVPSNHWEWLGKEICTSLAEGFQNFERKIPGFIKNGLIVSPETRTSSPLRICRQNDSLESVSTPGLYVIGEGAGYAGGIVTSAADGVRLACRARKEKTV